MCECKQVAIRGNHTVSHMLPYVHYRCDETANVPPNSPGFPKVRNMDLLYTTDVFSKQRKLCFQVKWCQKMPCAGGVDRRILGTHVLGESNAQNMERLEQAVHPLVQEERLRFMHVSMFPLV